MKKCTSCVKKKYMFKIHLKQNMIIWAKRTWTYSSLVRNVSELKNNFIVLQQKSFALFQNTYFWLKFFFGPNSNMSVLHVPRKIFGYQFRSTCFVPWKIFGLLPSLPKFSVQCPLWKISSTIGLLWVQIHVILWKNV